MIVCKRVWVEFFSIEFVGVVLERWGFRVVGLCVILCVLSLFFSLVFWLVLVLDVIEGI